MVGMNGAQIHLLLNHLPLLLPLVGAALICFGLIFKSHDVREAGAWSLVVAGLIAIPVYFTGAPAEDVLKNYPDASRLLIGDHRSSALIALLVVGGVGLVCARLLYSLRKNASRSVATPVWLALVLLSLVSFGFLAKTAHLGGVIRHEEIRRSDRF